MGPNLAFDVASIAVTPDASPARVGFNPTFHVLVRAVGRGMCEPTAATRLADITDLCSLI